MNLTIDSADQLLQGLHFDLNARLCERIVILQGRGKIQRERESGREREKGVGERKKGLERERERDEL